MHAELIETAKKLLCSNSGNSPSTADLRRAVSTAYYALFNFVSFSCVSDLLGSSAKNLTRAKKQIYRSIDHKDITIACEKAKKIEFGFPDEIRQLATFFVTMQKNRNKADYDASEDGNFKISHVQHLIGECEVVILQYNQADVDDRRAFTVLMAVKTKNR